MKAVIKDAVKLEGEVKTTPLNQYPHNMTNNWLEWCLKERAYKWSAPDAEFAYEYGCARYPDWRTYNPRWLTNKGYSFRGGRLRMEYNFGYLKDFMGEYACGGSFRAN